MRITPFATGNPKRTFNPKPSTRTRPNMTLAERAVRSLAAMKPNPQPPLLRLRHPLVLMHGFGVLAAFGRGGMLHEQAMHLRKRGVWAFAPNVSPYHTVSARADQWGTRLRHILRATDADQVHLVAHSMGGLDARFLVSRRGWAERVATLTTVSTPHRGTSAADFVMEQPDRLIALLAAAAEWLGRQILPDDDASDFTRAVRELRPAHVQGTFNPATPDAPSVDYRSYAGRAGRGTDVPINPFFRPLNHVIYEREGVNDGYVTTESARWGDFRGALDADHARQVGLAAGGLRRVPAADAFYQTLAQDLADEEDDRR
jgi:triacylglycerol lipase